VSGGDGAATKLLSEPSLWSRTLHERDEVKRQEYERRLHALWERQRRAKEKA
jgi:hypothetical protein